MIANKTLARMGLGPVWRLRGVEGPEAAPEVIQDAWPEAAKVANTEPRRVEEPRIEFAAPPASLQAPEWGWDELAETVRDCRKCRLCERRKQAVLGVGDREADWMFVGEGPGAEEDERGEPFVGQAGRLLDAMLAALGLKRGENVYIANTVKCRPPNNRTPEAEEMAACFPYLLRQIALVQPKLIVALGRPAAQALLDQEVRIGAARGRLFRFGELPVVVTYHPAYLLRNPADKSKAWEDLCFARRTIRQLS
jgi:DNA polymerase